MDGIEMTILIRAGGLRASAGEKQGNHITFLYFSPTRIKRPEKELEECEGAARTSDT
jgi:hypothetical protein